MTLAAAASLVGGADAQGPIYHDRVTFLGDDSYPAGGSPDFEALIRAATKDNRKVLGVMGDDGTNYYEYDFANNTLKAFVRTTGVEVVASTDLSANTVRLLVISK